MARLKDKQAAIKALERNGRVDPNDLIRAARDPEHACHGDFTWDIEQAAAERWRDQARHLIQQCKFEVIVEELGPRSVAYYTPDGKDGTFSALCEIRSVQKVSDVLAAELSALNGLATRVYCIAESKREFVGNDTVNSLREICGIIRDLRTAESMHVSSV